MEIHYDEPDIPIEDWQPNMIQSYHSVAAHSAGVLKHLGTDEEWYCGAMSKMLLSKLFVDWDTVLGAVDVVPGAEEAVVEESELLVGLIGDKRDWMEPGDSPGTTCLQSSCTLREDLYFLG